MPLPPSLPSLPLLNLPSPPLFTPPPQIRAIRRKMVEIMTREATSCDLKELVSGAPLVVSLAAASRCVLLPAGGLAALSPPRFCLLSCAAPALPTCPASLPGSPGHLHPLLTWLPPSPPLHPPISRQVGKFIPEAIGKEIEKACQGIYPLQVRRACNKCVCV